MRKQLGALALLAALSLAFLGVAHCWVNSAREKISLEETVLFGDKSAAEGIAVTYHTRDAAGHLFWDTAFAPAGEPLAPETAFRFYRTAREEGDTYSAGVSLDTASTNFHASGYLDLESEEGYGQLMLRPARDVASRTAPGETREEILALADYYDVYPLILEIRTQNCWYHAKEEDIGILAEKFHIPVPRGHQVAVSVTKDQAGDITDVNCRSVGESAGTVLHNCGVVTDEGAYLYLKMQDGDTVEPMEQPEWTAGGIFFIPFWEDSNQNLCVDLERMEVVYEMDLDARDVLNLYANADKSRLLLYTREKGRLWLSVIDRETSATLQRLGLLPIEEQMDITQWRGEGFLVVTLSGGGFQVVEERDGVYAPALVGQRNIDFERAVYFGPHYAWDGERLVMAEGASGSGTMSGLELCLAVYDSTGLSYAAIYRSSLVRELTALSNDIYRSFLSDNMGLAFTAGR